MELNYEEVAHMLTTWQEDFLKEGMEKGMKKGMEKAKLDSAKKMLEDKIDINLIPKYTGLMIKEIQELMKSNGD